MMHRDPLTAYTARHAAGMHADEVSVFEAYQPKHAAPDPIEVVVVRYTGHGIGHGDYRRDISLTPMRVPTPGPQAAALVEAGHRVPRIGRAL